MTHCELPEPKVRKQKKSLKKTLPKILGESILDDDPAILALRVDTNDNNGDYIEESDEEGKDEDSEDDAVPSKKTTTKKLANPELSWFDINVIQKNIREHEELAKKLSIDTIADELKKNARDYKYTDDS